MKKYVEKVGAYTRKSVKSAYRRHPSVAGVRRRGGEVASVVSQHHENAKEWAHRKVFDAASPTFKTYSEVRDGADSDNEIILHNNHRTKVRNIASKRRTIGHGAREFIRENGMAKPAAMAMVGVYGAIKTAEISAGYIKKLRSSTIWANRIFKLENLARRYFPVISRLIGRNADNLAKFSSDGFKVLTKSKLLGYGVLGATLAASATKSVITKNVDAPVALRYTSALCKHMELTVGDYENPLGNGDNCGVLREIKQELIENRIRNNGVVDTTALTPLAKDFHAEWHKFADILKEDDNKVRHNRLSREVRDEGFAVAKTWRKAGLELSHKGFKDVRDTLRGAVEDIWEGRIENPKLDELSRLTGIGITRENAKYLSKNGESCLPFAYQAYLANAACEASYHGMSGEDAVELFSVITNVAKSVADNVEL